MQIIYNQTASNNSCNEAIESMGIKRCYLKHIHVRKKNNNFTKKAHHHTGFEAHAVISGEQKYEISGDVFTVSAGELLIIPPNICHKVVSISDAMEKFSLCFDTEEPEKLPYVYTKASDALISSFLLAKNEYASRLAYSETCIASAVLFTLSSILRLARVKPRPQSSLCNENPVFTIARRYIDDNTHYDISTSDVANYCHLSTKQLNRIFAKEAALTLGTYIRRKRSEKIRDLLESSELTLSEISDMMNFKNEYYFNTFFKRSMGMSPGAYTKMVRRAY